MSILRTRNVEAYDFLPAALELEQTPPAPLGRWIIWIIFTLVLSLIAWACIGTIDEVAVSRGKVVPSGRVKVVQPLEEGVIGAIHVDEGDKVKAGQLLMELDPAMDTADLEGLRKNLAAARLEKEMLAAERDGRAPEEQVLSGLLADSGLAPGFLEELRRLKTAGEAAHRAKADALKLTIAQREKEISLERTKQEQAEKKYMLEQLTQQEKPSEDKSMLDALNRRNDLLTAQQEVESAITNVRKLTDSLEEAKKNLQALNEERGQTLLASIVEKDKTIHALEAELLKAQTKVGYRKLVSPADGTVLGIAAQTIGGIVTPAQPVITIVPDGTELIVEGTLLNKDIGFVSAGQEVRVKIDTFPFQKYGTLRGEVTEISADAIDDPELGTVYRMKVKLLEQRLNVNGSPVPVTPGMTVSAEVKTGDRKIIEFFLSPILKYAEESLTLR
ncbi:HlyD family type I secretion periplasmic adaptor subunit [Paenibacillus mucilaginosus]|uniref:Membrane-fusion protein n=1 Tax=Paenibacillus mucilaginosus (strain KNP414) TaxID=1036673 RepID=F8FMN7_PAEMK|nr:HlyD family type I secretion periplasmic adaptor subunit [Paenibacillus mucilaginosus]AEI44208.1 membrane-fusion protein [Paenibacillus mucilaginosus KNP414]MCG7216622.1 HlyD family type I secretion periplasmic adaptor subunit [Paenibacillus mucilaginosus]